MTTLDIQAFAPFFPASEACRVLHGVYITYPNSLIVNKKGGIVWRKSNENFFWYNHFNRISNLDATGIRQNPEKFEEQKNNLARTIEGIDLSQSVQLSPNVNHAYFCHPFGWHAYGHIWDSFQRLYQIKKAGKRAPILITSDHRRISDFYEHMRLWGYESHSIFTFHPAFKSLYVPRLVVGELLEHPGELSADVVRFMIQKYVLENDRIDKDLRIPGIYLDRNGTGISRHVTNNDEVHSFLKEKGYRIVYGTEPLSEVLQLFHAARKVIGGHGAAFANTIFCNAEAEIYEFISRTRVFTGFRDRPRLGDHFEQILVDADEGHNLAIDMTTLKEIA